MRLHIPQTTLDPERPPDIAFAREKFVLTARDPKASLIDINELSRRLSIGKPPSRHIQPGEYLPGE